MSLHYCERDDVGAGCVTLLLSFIAHHMAIIQVSSNFSTMTSYR